MDGNEMRLIVDIWEMLQDLGGIVSEKQLSVRVENIKVLLYVSEWY